MKRPESVCQRCVKDPRYGGCCSIESANKQAQIPITLTDITRIRERTGLSRHSFVDVFRAPPDVVKVHTYSSPLLGACIRSGVVMVLKTKPTEKDSSIEQCVFLKEGEGCTLGRDRPLVCKVFPFLPESQPKQGFFPLNLTTKNYDCLAIEEAGHDMPSVLALMGMSKEELGALFSQFLDAATAHQKASNK